MKTYESDNVSWPARLLMGLVALFVGFVGLEACGVDLVQRQTQLDTSSGRERIVWTVFGADIESEAGKTELSRKLDSEPAGENPNWVGLTTHHGLVIRRHGHSFHELYLKNADNLNDFWKQVLFSEQAEVESLRRFLQSMTSDDGSPHFGYMEELKELVEDRYRRGEEAAPITVADLPSPDPTVASPSRR